MVAPARIVRFGRPSLGVGTDANTEGQDMTGSTPRAPFVPGSTATYPVLPLRDIVVFPHMIVPLFVGREKSIRALEEVVKNDGLILLATQKNAGDDDPETKDIYEIGTLARVLQLLKLPDSTVKVLVEGVGRAKALSYSASDNFYQAEAEALDEEPGKKVEVEALARSVVSEFENYVKLNKKISPEIVAAVSQIDEPPKLADTVASHLAVKIADRQAVLEVMNVAHRLEKVLSLMESEMSVLQVEKRIRSRVKRQMEKTQREYYLNEQMKAIQKELGGSHRRAQLSRLAARHSLGQEVEDQEGSQGRAGGARRRSLRPRQGQGPHRRISRRAAARQPARRPDPVPCRPSGCRQDLARQVDRQGDRPRVRAHVARRRA
jgi:ATP-dependent Lon protease